MIRLGDLGELVAYEDEVIKRALINIKDQENKLMKRCKDLQDFKKNNFYDFIPYINDELEVYREFILYKKLHKEEQYKALFKILEYLNTINSKSKEIETQKILLKLKLIEKELIPYKEILM
tara:strand:- start:1364 stop:1726 length:363 start_codon:yes stop_codon:yes gene_type:complete